MKDIIYLNPGANQQPHVWMQTVVDGDVPTGATSNAWVWARTHNATTRALTGLTTPSAVTSYTPAIGSSAPALSISTSKGFVTEYGYNGENASSIAHGVEGSTEVVLERNYEDGSTVPGRARLISTIERPREAGTIDDDKIELIEFDYGYEATDSSKLDWMLRREERELSTENGPSGAAQKVDYWEFYDNAGQLIVSLDPDGIVTRYEYDDLTGTLTKVTRNYDPTSVSSIPEIRLPNVSDPDYTSNPITGLSANSDGTLITQYDRDLSGRVVKRVAQGGVTSWTVRGMDTDSTRSGIQYYSVITMPHQVESPGEYNGPATKRLLDAASKMIRIERWDVEDDSSYDPGSESYASNDALIDSVELARTIIGQDASGQMISRQVWWDLANDYSSTTSYEYDSQGRLSLVTDPNGTKSWHTYDVLDRRISTSVGTGTSGSLVREFKYDGDPGVTTPVSGVGNGNITAVYLYDGETANARITRNYYDDRDRLIASFAPDSAMAVTQFDNLNRVVKSATYTEPASTPSQSAIETLASSLPYTDATFGDRSWYRVVDYGQRGMAWRQRTAIDPASGTPSYLDWLSWLDADGTELAAWGPNAPMTVYEYDAHNRVSTVYVSDRLKEATDGLDFEDATVVTGDTVLEQAEYSYDTTSGVLNLIESKMRVHDATATGALADADSITSYQGFIYDNSLRRVATVNFGTNKSDFADGTTTAPNLSSYDTLSELRNATGVLFNWREFNARSQVEEMVAIQSGTATTDEIRTKYLYDDMYRNYAVIENYDDASLTWNATSGRYEVSSGLDHTDLSEDRVTSFVFNDAGQITKRVAHIAAESGGSTVEDAQITEYEYGTGTTLGSPSNPMDSLVLSNNLLTRVKYPDESTGEPGATAKYYVDYAYNRLGELRGVTDQNGTVREFERDERGRVLADIVDTVGSYTVNSVSRDVDSSIRRIGYEYDTLGRMTNATSHTSTASSGNVRDEIEIEYTPLWQVKKIYQQHDGLVNTSTSPAVEYVYDNADPDGAEDNYSRLIKVNYPTDVENSRGTVKYTYDSGIDDRISRVSTLEVLGLNGYTVTSNPAYADLIDYERIGLGMTVKATIGLGGAWDVMLDRTVDHEGDRTSGAYPAFDKFGRIVSHMWVRDDFDEHGSVSDLSNQPAYMEVTHTYDRSSNRLSYNDNRQGAKLPNRNRAFIYDRLNRLTEELRSPVPSGSTYTPQHSSKQWELDTLGNWSNMLVDADNDGSYTDYQGVGYKDVREHNMANEIDSGLQYDQRLLRSGTTPIYRDHLYDDSGNMTDERAGTALPSLGTLMAGQMHKYDAWNRLVKTEYVPSSGSNTDVSVNTYNALGWRTSREFDESTGAFDGLDQKRLYYYGADWRMLEERIDTDVDTDSDSVGGTDDDTDWIGQQFWGIRYIDDAVGKRVDRDGDGDFVDADCTYWYQLTDTQFSVGVVLDETGFVYERIEYDAYGVAKHRFGGDTDGNGQYDFFDISTFYGSGAYTISDTTNYHADFDRNADGSIDSLDLGTSPSAVPTGWISDPSSSSGPDNSIGYAGYVFNHEREDYTVRFRSYNPELGRWMQRDPLRYVDGSNLVAYVISSPVVYQDPSGLRVAIDPKASDAFKNATMDQIKEICPSATLNDDGTISVECPAKSDDPCDSSPGCNMLKDLIDSNHLYGIREETDNEVSTYTHRNRAINLVDPGGEKTHRNTGGKSEPWEDLWHELAHASNHNNGTYPTTGRPGTQPYAEEEMHAINQNNEVRKWKRDCSPSNPDKPGPPDADPFGHPAQDGFVPTLRTLDREDGYYREPRFKYE